MTPLPTAPARSLASRHRTAAGGLKIRVHASPKASRDGVEGIKETVDGPVLKVRVRAVAEDGEANRAVAAVVAAWLGIPKSHVEVTAGAKSRFKTLAVAGDAGTLERLLASRLADLASE